MKKLLLILLVPTITFGQTADEKAIAQTLDTWHQAAAEAHFTRYFSMVTDDFVFVDTDATEHWNLKDFKAYSKPHFDKGRAWAFKAVDRHIYVNGNFAWFDEMLDTQMKGCRGSGVLKKENGVWKIAHYVLSMTVPNDNAETVIKIKAPLEDQYFTSLRKR